MKSFRQYRKEADNDLHEQIVNKAYALTQNSQFNSIKQRVNTLSFTIHSLTQRIKSTNDQSEKIDLLADAIDKVNRMLVIQSDLSMITKNISVANVLLADDFTKILERHIQNDRMKR